MPDLYRHLREKFEHPEEVAEYVRAASRGLKEWETKVVKQYFHPPADLLDVGCGAGREAIPLASMGFRVTAVDLIGAMVEAARSRMARLPVVVREMDARTLQFPDGSFDGVLMVEQFLGSIPGGDNRLAAVKEAWRVLRPGGIFVMSGISRHRGMLRRLYWGLVDPLRKGKQHPALEEGDLWRKRVSGSRSPVKMVVHYFTIEEGERLLKEAGFEIREARSVSDFLAGRTSSDSGYRGENDYALLFVGRKPPAAPAHSSSQLTVFHPDADDWDRFTQQQPDGHLLQSARWGMLERLRGFRAVQLAVRDASGIAGGISCLIRRIPGSRRTILYAPRGPILDPERGARAVTLLVGATRRLAEEERAVFLKVDPAVSSDHPVPLLLRAAGFLPPPVTATFLGSQPPVTLRLSLEGAEEDLFASFHPKHRQYIRKNERDGIRIRTVPASEIPRHLPYLHRWRVGGVPKSMAFYEELFRLFPDDATLFAAEIRGELLALRVLMTWGEKGWEFYGVRTPLHPDRRPTYSLVWEMIRTAKGKGCRWYDFRGIPAEGSGMEGPGCRPGKMEGIARFKAGFGGERVEFAGELDLALSTRWYRWWNAALRGMAAWRRLGGGR